MPPSLWSCLLAAAAPLAVVPPTAIAARTVPATSPPLSSVAHRVGVAPRVPRGLHPLGKAPPATRLVLDFVLRPRDPAAITALAEAVSDPGSPDFRHFLGRGAFSARFGATGAEVSAVEASLASAGLRHPVVEAGGLAIRFDVSAATAERALSMAIGRFRTRSGTTLDANLEAPRLAGAAGREVIGVLGLDSLGDERVDLVREPRGSTGLPPRQAGPPLRGATMGPAPNLACSRSIRTAGAGLSANEIASAYGYSKLYAAGDLGAGSTVAVIELGPLVPADVRAYSACYDGLDPEVSVVPVDGGPVLSDASSEVEADLDVEDLLGLAPRARILVYEGPDLAGAPSDSGAYDTLAAAIDADQAEVISTSWGECEQEAGAGVLAAENALFEQAALQGQSVVAAAGDSGSEDCFNPFDTARRSPLAVDDPAAQPYVTGVGGTTLALAAGGSSYRETVWNTGPSARSAGAGGGGLSMRWWMPAYQAGAPASLGVVNAFSATGRCGSANGYCREVPDVADDAGAPYAIYCSEVAFGCTSDGWTPVGGTSAAAPTFAALLALADSSPGCLTGGPVGFANPALYAIAAGPEASSAFGEITGGDNDFTRTHAGRYPAEAGYSLAGGLGSPLAGDGSDDGLVAQLCTAAAHRLGARSLPRPAIASLSPAAGYPGERVVLSGRILWSVTAVRFGSARARFSRVGRDELVAVVPEPDGAATVRVTAFGPGGASGAARTAVFHYRRERQRPISA